MTDTVKKKAVHVVRLTKKAAKGTQKAEFKDIQPGTVFDCPKDLVKELTAAGAITAPGKTTASEASDAEPLPEDDEDETGGEGGDGDDEDDTGGDGAGEGDGDGDGAGDDLDKDGLIAKAKGLGIKGVAKNWSEDTLRAKIAEAEAAAGEDEDVL